LTVSTVFADDKAKQETMPGQTGMQQKSQTGMEEKQMSGQAGLEGQHFKSYIRGTELIGKDVLSRSREDLGTVDDIVIGKDGRANFLIISHGGVMGVGDSLIPVPFSAFNQQAASSDDNVILNVDKQELKDAPSFASNEWPDFSDSAYEQKVHGYFGSSPSRESEGMMEMQKPDVKGGTSPESQQTGPTSPPPATE
jgi:sporulation protein YlmC with PRC-barrel domain